MEAANVALRTNPLCVLERHVEVALIIVAAMTVLILMDRELVVCL